MRRLVHRALLASLWLAALGCMQTPSSPDTGARAAAGAFYDALLQQDWARAYDQLHADCRGRWSRDQFTRRARTYRQALGFEPAAVHLRTCEEQGETATVRVSWSGSAAGRPRVFKDAVVLRRDATGWGVMLPKQFGTESRKRLSPP